MTKEEKIKDAYREWWDKMKSFVDENGWFDKNAFCIIRLKYEDVCATVDFVHDLSTDEMIPKEIQGIRDNNGYTKIESEKDIPEEEGVYWVLRPGFHKPMYRIINDMFDSGEKAYWLENYTHFIKVTRPENLPIY